MSKRKRNRVIKGVFLVGGVLIVAVVASISLRSWLPKLKPWPVNEASGPSTQAGAVDVPTPSSSAESDDPASAAGRGSGGHAVAEASSAPQAEPANQPPRPTGPVLMNYYVMYGDTIGSLAQQFETTPEKLLEDNPGLKDSGLVSGTVIKVPDRAAERGELRPRYVWPAEGPITTPFGEQGSSWIGGYHMGLDIGASTGDVVWAAGDGVIVDTGTNGMGRGYGTYILIDQSNGWRTLYAHLSKVYREAGYTVRQGEPIGEVGSTGFADGPHLHFEVWHDDQKLDPIQFLP